MYKQQLQTLQLEQTTLLLRPACYQIADASAMLYVSSPAMHIKNGLDFSNVTDSSALQQQP